MRAEGLVARIDHSRLIEHNHGRSTVWTGLQWLSWLPLPAVVALSLVLNVWGLDEQGYGNTYYAAAARSMTLSWSNFFFGALDPGGFISVDKPPLFLWIDAASVRLFGYSSWSLLLPSALAGAASVGLLWLIVHRYFGMIAATTAALVLALTPIWVAVHRLNLPEPFYILALVGAAGATLLSLEGRRWWAWTIAAGVLVGLAFNAKMLVAWVPGPALALAIAMGLADSWRLLARQWLGHVALLGVVTLSVSASWMLVVDAWPESDRPYVGGSFNNTVSDLVLGYNGIGRFDGEIASAGAAAGRGAGGVIAGEPGPLRMFDSSNGGQIAWFLPFAVIGGALALWRWRRDRLPRTAVVLWLGWTILFVAVFSQTKGIYHSYYTAAIAPGVAALAGIGTVALIDLVRRNQAWVAVAFGLAVITLYVQLLVTGRVPGFFTETRPVTIAAIFAGLLVLSVSPGKRLAATAGALVIVAGLLLLPAAWSSYESANASLNTTLPQAGPRDGIAGYTFGSDLYDDGINELAAWLQANETTRARWHLAVPTAQNASTLMAKYNLSVIALGGFQGLDPAITVERFARLVRSGDVRFVLTAGEISTAHSQASVAIVETADPDAVETADPAAVETADLAAVAMPPPDAAGVHAIIAATQAVCFPIDDSALHPRFQGSLYDCAGQAESMAPAH